MRFSCLLFLIVHTLASIDTKTNKESTTTWVGEHVEDLGYFHSIRLASDEPIVRTRSKFQLIEVFQSQHFGKILVLDGVMQLTEKDADGYNGT